MDATTEEIERGDRFAFGENWSRFLGAVDDAKVHVAERALQNMLKRETLRGMTFCDVGSGSGLHSVAASRLGAEVTAFDYDPTSVACTKELARRFDAELQVQQGSILDPEFLESFEEFDVVYSWGVLHHTGDMWAALERLTSLVRPSGYVFIALYNDQGGPTRRWTVIKRAYNRSPRPVRTLLAVGTAVRLWWFRWLVDALRGDPMRSWRTYGDTRRGMSLWRDVVDWVGGWPYEAAKPGDVVEFFRESGFVLDRLRVTPGHGCNEYLFRRTGG